MIARRINGNKKDEPKLIFDLPLISSAANFDRISGQQILGDGIQYFNGYTRLQGQGVQAINPPRITGLDLSSIIQPNQPYQSFTREFEINIQSLAYAAIAVLVHVGRLQTTLGLPYQISVHELTTTLNKWFKVKEVYDMDLLQRKRYLDDKLVATYQWDTPPINSTSASFSTIILNGTIYNAASTSVAFFRNIKYWKGIKE